jgi:aminopeptidase N
MLNFDGISYAKGASALRQLVTWLGEKDFLAGINTHFARHKFANATLADFIDNLASATERDVHAWADSWLRTTGVDTLTPTLTAGPDGTHTLTVEHHGSRPHRIAVGLYDNDLGVEGRLALRDRLEADVPGSEPTVIGKRPALLLLNDGDLSYAKVRFDPESFQTVRTALAGLPEPLTRAVVWNALRDAVRDGELPAMAYIDAARAHLPHESDLALVQGVLSFAAAQVADRYLPAEDRPTALATLTDLCRDLIRRTEDGSHPGLRLTAVRHYIDVAAHPDTISAWFSEGTVPGGPELDPELRWRVLGRLAVLGAIDDAVIEAELVQDPSATGQEGAARCRAALPDPEAKRRAWEEMFTSDHLSNYLFIATAQGFWQPEQTHLVREYVERYWADAVAVSTRRGPAIAEAAGRYAFPVHAVTPETLALGEACLRDADPIPALRRKLVDQLDDLTRALKVRTA